MKPKYYVPLLTILLIAVVFMSGCASQESPTKAATITPPAETPETTPPAMQPPVPSRIEQGQITPQTAQQKTAAETGKIIEAPDTKKVLFTLNGTEVIEGYCSTAGSFAKYGVILPKDCEGIFSTNTANYCELGNERGENVNNYYCRPMRFMKCKIVSSSGEIEDIKYYGITKVLKCNDTKEQLIDILVESCTTDGFNFYCS